MISNSGKQPDSVHKQSIWASDFIPDGQRPATLIEIEEAEKRLGIDFPQQLRKQLLVQNGGRLICLCEEAFEDAYVAFMDKFPGVLGDAAIDGILPLEEWQLAATDHWFEATSFEGLNLLVKIAGHSESQLCLDYRDKSKQIPSLTYFFIGYQHEESNVCENIIEFIDELIAFKAKYAIPAL